VSNLQIKNLIIPTTILPNSTKEVLMTWLVRWVVKVHLLISRRIYFQMEKENILEYNNNNLLIFIKKLGSHIHLLIKRLLKKLVIKLDIERNYSHLITYTPYIPKAWLFKTNALLINIRCRILPSIKVQHPIQIKIFYAPPLLPNKQKMNN
jgi:hypothetical protein